MGGGDGDGGLADLEVDGLRPLGVVVDHPLPGIGPPVGRNHRRRGGVKRLDLWLGPLL